MTSGRRKAEPPGLLLPPWGMCAISAFVPSADLDYLNVILIFNIECFLFFIFFVNMQQESCLNEAGD